MERDRAIDILQSHAAEARGLGATALYLFGLTARDEARERSNVDIFIDYDPEKFSFVELIRLRESLSHALGHPADLTTRRALHPALKARIEREAIRVF
jgi:predicted nucleotidyltransferase